MASPPHQKTGTPSSPPGQRTGTPSSPGQRTGAPSTPLQRTSGRSDLFSTWAQGRPAPPPVQRPSTASTGVQSTTGRSDSYSAWAQRRRASTPSRQRTSTASTPSQRTGAASTPSQRTGAASTPSQRTSTGSSSGTKDKGKEIEKEEATEDPKDPKGKSKLELTRDKGRVNKDPPSYNWVNAPDVTEKFKHFDIITGEVKDHSFLNYSVHREFVHRDERSQKRYIKKQWKKLKKHVPDSLYIRVYKNNIDLVRAVIVGPQGTPYHDGLFFIDIHLPRGYPEEAPYVNYHLSGKLNENFDIFELLKEIAEDKKWWQRNKLSIRQVLLTIQENLLIAEPFFNQGAYRNVDRDCYKKYSISYNEKIFLKSCRTMLSILRNPPTDFEPLVAQHFRSRGLFILEAIKAYTNERCLVGSFVDDGASPSDSMQPERFKFADKPKARSSSLNPKQPEKSKSDGALIIKDSSSSSKPIQQPELSKSAGKRIMNDGTSSTNPTQQPELSKSAGKRIMSDGTSSTNPTQQSDKNKSHAKPINDGLSLSSSNPTEQSEKNKSQSKPSNDGISSSNPTQQTDKNKSQSKPSNDGTSSSNPTEQMEKNKSQSKPSNDGTSSSNPTEQTDKNKSDVKPTGSYTLKPIKESEMKAAFNVDAFSLSSSRLRRQQVRKFKLDAQVIYTELQIAFKTMDDAINRSLPQIDEEGTPERKDGVLKKIVKPFKCFKGE